MKNQSNEGLTRRKALRATATAASVPALSALGSQGAAASDSIQFYLYPGADDDMFQYTDEAREEFRDHFASQLADLDVDLLVAEMDQVPDYVDELLGDYHGTFEYHVKEQTYFDDDGSTLHMWFNMKSTGNANTPGLVDGYSDAFSDMSMDDYLNASFGKRRNMYFHEALHALMEEGEYGYACDYHSKNNDDEHTCGDIDRYSGSTYDYLRVTPMATSYDDSPDELGDSCDGLPSYYPSDRYYTYEFSDCTMETLDNFFFYNGL